MVIQGNNVAVTTDAALARLIPEHMACEHRPGTAAFYWAANVAINEKSGTCHAGSLGQVVVYSLHLH